MDKNTTLLHAGKAGLVISSILFLSVCGCVGPGDGSGTGAGAGDAAGQGNLIFLSPDKYLVMDNYIYYPNYEMYYSNDRHEYAYQENGVWVTRRVPQGVSVAELQASPSIKLTSVKMDFSGIPVVHHEDLAKKYPKAWVPTQDEVSRNENR